ncbi:hypothetical protein MRBBS_2550 [Marinobacter sp. BSs20148]|nr:hypothetical protein MRBBS_2550 [Marinobacter sp. BSs20148]
MSTVFMNIFYFLASKLLATLPQSLLNQLRAGQQPLPAA